MITATTTDLPAWVTATCPDWCTLPHRAEHVWDHDTEMHPRDFGDGADGAYVRVYAKIDAAGRTLATEATTNVDNCDTADEVAGWFRDAAAFMRQVTPQV